MKLKNIVRLIPILNLLFIIFFSSSSFAFKNNTWSAGLGYLSENFLNKISTKDDGSTSFLGQANYTLNIKYDYTLNSNWFVAPQLGYTLLPRTASGDTAKVSITHLQFLFGQNANLFGSSNWDWSFGPGLIQHQIKGKGGTTSMNNGTGTATFAVPGRTITVQKISTNLGGSYTNDNLRVGLDLIFESFFSNTKRTQSLMLSFNYQFSGGY